MRVDAALLEEGIHTERARFIRHDRHDVFTDRFILEQRCHERDGASSCGHLAAGALVNERPVVVQGWRFEEWRMLRPTWHSTPERLATLPQILDFR